MKAYKGYERNEGRDFETLPKGAYVIKILGAKEEVNKRGDGSYIRMAFDIAEGEYAGFYDKSYKADKREDKKWSNDAYIYLNCPKDNDEQFIIDNFNKFITAVEDSNEGYHWNWDENTLKGKLVGAKFYIEQSEYNDKIYDHTKAKWFVAAQKVRDGKAGKLPNDKLLTQAPKPAGSSDFMSISDSIEEEVPWN